MSYRIDSPRARLEEFFLSSALNPLQDFLARELIERWARESGHRWRRCVLSPLSTLLGCIYKHLSPGVSCRDVEDWVSSKLPDTTAFADNAGDDFCTARGRLPFQVFARALEHTAKLASNDNAIWLVDGTGLTLPRCPAHFEVFGKAHGKARLPGARLLLFTDALSGAVMHADLTGCDQGEIRQFLRSLDSVPAGTTVVGDRQFGSYLAFAKAESRGVDLVTRLNVSRKPVRVEPLGKGDEIHVWKRPHPSMSAFPDQARAAPGTLRVRVVRGRIERKGYRPVDIALTTNLMDAVLWPPEKIIALYGRRWLAENDIRDLKLRHGLHLLTCKGEDTVRKEVWSALIAYNAIKIVQKRTGKPPRELSHERCRAILMETCGAMSNAPTTRLPRMHRKMLQQLGRTRLRRQERPPQPRAIVHDPTTSYPILYRSRESWYQHYLTA